MMLKLALRNLRRQPLRNALTLAGVAAATLTFVLLRTVLSMWAMGEEYTANERIATRHKTTFVMTLPVRSLHEVEQVPGVKAAAPMNWFGGRLPGHERDFFANMATDPAAMLDVYQELELPPAQREAWVENQRGAIVGEVLAEKYGWAVGDEVTLAGTLYPGDWRFTIEGIYGASRRTMDRSTLYFHFDYFNQNVREEARDQVGWIVSRVDSSADLPAIAASIDERFAGSANETASMNEHALTASFLGMLDALLRTLGLISLVIVVVLALILGNTVAMGVRERLREYGVLRALGFDDRHVVGLVMIEATWIGLVGAGAGVLAAVLLIDGAIGPFVEQTFAGWFPYFHVQSGDAWLAVGLAVVGAVLAASFPARTACRVQVTQALRTVG